MKVAADEVGSGIEAAFEDLPCVALIERDGRVVARNALARRMTGSSAGAKDGARIEEVLAEAYGFADTEERCRFDCLLVRKYGPPMPMNAVAQGTIFGGDVCRLLLLLERESAGDRNMVDGLLVENLLDAIPEATAITQAKGIVHVNAEFTRLFGYSLMESVGRELLDLVVPDGLTHESELMRHTVKQRGRAEMESVRRTRSGEEIDVYVRMVPLAIGGSTSGLLVTYQDIRAQKQEKAKLTHSARHDGLTGLANRAEFLDRVERTLGRLKRRPDRRFAVIFVDLDGFKQVNDTYGHAAGDELLVEIADRLRRCLRPQDGVARLGGDEFALLLDESGDGSNIDAVVARIQREISRPVELSGGQTASVSSSMGVVIAVPEYAPEAILEDADAAMYRAKAAGKSRHVVVDGKDAVRC